MWLIWSDEYWAQSNSWYPQTYTRQISKINSWFVNWLCHLSDGLSRIHFINHNHHTVCVRLIKSFFVFVFVLLLHPYTNGRANGKKDKNSVANIGWFDILNLWYKMESFIPFRTFALKYRRICLWISFKLPKEWIVMKIKWI